MSDQPKEEVDDGDQEETEDARVVLNVGGTRYETFRSTLVKYPDSLLGAMFSRRNLHLLRADPRDGSFFFDRSGAAFEGIINFYRTGKIFVPTAVSREAMEAEVEYWQIPASVGCLLGDQLASVALASAREKAGHSLQSLEDWIIAKLRVAAMSGAQQFTIEIRPDDASFGSTYYDFLNHTVNRELLIRDLSAMNFDASLSNVTSSGGHFYVLSIQLWSQYTMPQIGPPSLEQKILDEIRSGVEVKTQKVDHVLSTTSMAISH